MNRVIVEFISNDVYMGILYANKEVTILSQNTYSPSQLEELPVVQSLHQPSSILQVRSDIQTLVFERCPEDMDSTTASHHVFDFQSPSWFDLVHVAVHVATGWTLFLNDNNLVFLYKDFRNTDTVFLTTVCKTIFEKLCNQTASQSNTENSNKRKREENVDNKIEPEPVMT
jgi:hypothetical protein